VPTAASGLTTYVDTVFGVTVVQTMVTLEEGSLPAIELHAKLDKEGHTAGPTDNQVIIKHATFVVTRAALCQFIVCYLERDGHAASVLANGKLVRIIVNEAQQQRRKSVGSDRSLSSYLRLRLPATEALRFLFRDNYAENQLYAFQKAGVEWLVNRERCILGDDMGLGKTAQVITAARRLFVSGDVRCALVVCPKTLTSNWEAEIDRWGDGLIGATILPTGATRDKVWRALWGNLPICITTYEQMRTLPKRLLEQRIDLVVADEAHRLRNAGSQTAQAFRKLSVKRLWALTGTPVERDARDAATLLSILLPARFSPGDESRPIRSLRASLRQVMLRRRKDEVLDQLPKCIMIRQSIELSEAQRSSYNVRLEQYGKVGSTDNFLALLTGLREICDADPKTGASAKLDRIVDIVDTIERMSEKAVVFSYTLRPLAILQKRIRALSSVPVWLLVGDMDSSARKEAIAQFRGNHGAAVLLASTRVASEGITLTEANNVIFVNEWWNPSSNLQARDRVLRIGQKKIVSSYSFVCRSTVEELLDKALRDKSELFANLVDAAVDELLVHEIAGLERSVLEPIP
jgi:SNF2 family DNA or RNA helicase